MSQDHNVKLNENFKKPNLKFLHTKPLKLFR